MEDYDDDNEQKELAAIEGRTFLQRFFGRKHVEESTAGRSIEDALISDDLCNQVIDGLQPLLEKKQTNREVIRSVLQTELSTRDEKEISALYDTYRAGTDARRMDALQKQTGVTLSLEPAEKKIEYLEKIFAYKKNMEELLANSKR